MFVQIDAHPVRTINSLACATSSNNRLIGHIPMFCPMILLIRTDNTKTETKGKQGLSPREKGSITKVCKPKMTRVIVPKVLVLTNIFSCQSIFGKKKTKRGCYFSHSTGL